MIDLTKITRLKTIKETGAKKYDARVNEALDNGWVLLKISEIAVREEDDEDELFYIASLGKIGKVMI